MFLIRPFIDADEEQVKALILRLKKFYPGIESWAEKVIGKIKEGKSRCLVVASDKTVGGIAISKMTKFPDKNDAVKLNTFFLDRKSLANRSAPGASP